ncbi:hypothetical protein [Pseudomonas sp. RIT-PI-q]|uniref:hypothetical protein n=1 Tax=Pseudomonas sp. RIT-PI-q TaxID=1690247 RepID=UPI000751276A|nr:hypothetical protein [Pseudomonas sp. RIT-PI-q]
MNAEDENKSMIANLFLKGKPLVLNYQLMENRLKRPRLTPSQQFEYKRQLLSEGGFLTVADSEKDEPLLIHFRSEDDRYTLRVATPGKFYGYFLSMEDIVNTDGEKQSIRNFVVLKEGSPTRFYLENVSPGVERLLNVGRKSVIDLEGLEAAVHLAVLQAVQNQIDGPTYLYTNKVSLENEGQLYFSDTFLPSAQVMWDPQAVQFTVGVRGTGILELSDIG